MKRLHLVNALATATSRNLPSKYMAAAVLASALWVHPATAQLIADKPTEASQAISGSDLKAIIVNMAPSALMAVDPNRGSIIETIVNQWKTELGGTDANAQDGLVSELRSSLSALRADNLLAASNARTLDGLKQIFAASDAAAKAAPSAQHKLDGQKTLGALTNNLVYTPITPCNLVDTRKPRHRLHLRQRRRIRSERKANVQLLQRVRAHGGKYGGHSTFGGDPIHRCRWRHFVDDGQRRSASDHQHFLLWLRAGEHRDSGQWCREWRPV